MNEKYLQNNKQTNSPTNSKKSKTAGGKAKHTSLNTKHTRAQQQQQQQQEIQYCTHVMSTTQNDRK